MSKLRDVFRYHFNEEGHLVDQNGKRWQFTSAEEYTSIADALIDEMYVVLIEECGLQQMNLRPLQSIILDNCRYDNSIGFCFASHKFGTAETVLILIHGSGDVRAGIWSRRLILNESLDEGSQVPYIRRAQTLGWGVIVLNTNQHYREIDPELNEVAGLSNPDLHVRTAFERLIKPCKASTFFIVAHSAGGSAADKLLKLSEQLHGKIRAIALTDSAFIGERPMDTAVAINFSCQKCSNPYQYYETVSRNTFQMFAGSDSHESSSAAAIDAVFFMLQNYQRFFASDASREQFLAEVASRVRGGCPNAEHSRRL